jgi:hypothetical protein
VSRAGGVVDLYAWANENGTVLTDFSELVMGDGIVIASAPRVGAYTGRYSRPLPSAPSVWQLGGYQTNASGLPRSVVIPMEARAVFASGAEDGALAPGSMTFAVTPDTAPAAGERIEVTVIARVSGFVAARQIGHYAESSYFAALNGVEFFGDTVRVDGNGQEQTLIPVDGYALGRTWVDIGETFEFAFGFESIASMADPQALPGGGTVRAIVTPDIRISARVVPSGSSAALLCLSVISALRRRR